MNRQDCSSDERSRMEKKRSKLDHKIRAKLPTRKETICRIKRIGSLRLCVIHVHFELQCSEKEIQVKDRRTDPLSFLSSKSFFVRTTVRKNSI